MINNKIIIHKKFIKDFILKRGNPKNFTLIIVIFFKLTLAILYINNIYLKKNFTNFVNKKEFYESFRGESDQACRTLQYYKPEIIFLGDSSAFHAWDFYNIQKIKNKKIGHCILPGFTATSIPLLIEYFDKINYTPKTIILSETYRSFADEDYGKFFYEGHKKKIKDYYQSIYQYGLKISGKNLLKKKLFQTSFPESSDIEKYLIDNEKKIDEITDYIFNKNLNTQGYKNIDSAKKHILEIKYYNLYKNEKFCNFITQNNITLIISRIPLHNQIENIVKLNKFYEKKLSKTYEYLNNCTNKKLIIFNNDSFERKNIYFFLNRYDEELFFKFKKFSSTYENVYYNENFLDLTHLNRFGSKIFTLYFLEKTKNLF